MILQEVSLNPVDVFKTVFFILGIPLALGMALGHWFPGLADRVRKPFKLFSLIFFIVIVMGALAANWTYFLHYVGGVVFAVFLHNALALNIGYWSGRAARLEERDCRALCIEVGYALTHNGEWLTDISMETLGHQYLDRILEWCLGSLLVAPALALAVFGLLYAGAKTLAGRPDTALPKEAP